MKRIEVLQRPIDHRGKLLGKGGTYTIDDASAIKYAEDDLAKIVEDLGKDDPFVNQDYDQLFLAKIKTHALPIMQLLEEAFKAKDKAEREALEAQIAEERKIENKIDNLLTNTEENKSEAKSSSTSEPIDSPQGTGTEGADGSIEQSDYIPDDFPGKQQLVNKSIDTMTKVKATTFDGLVAEGISARTATLIGAKLSELESAEVAKK